MGTSTVSSNKRSKAAKSALAVTLALLLALGGTLAYLTSQMAVNTTRGTTNPGARLHDDFIWAGDSGNKDVYVENFGSQYVLARVQLKEYLEVGQGAGAEGFAGTKFPSAANAVKDDPANWQPYDFNDPGTDIHSRFDLGFGGSTTYMPTFNKNMNSNDPDVNGSYDDAAGPYSGYRSYIVGEVLTAEETLTGTDASGISGGRVEHAAKATLGAQLISMAEWKTTYNSQPGPYWVYDAAEASGEVWAYWAQPIAPGSTTGLLLDSVRLKDASIGDWYYQIAAIGDFVTTDELEEPADPGNPVYYLNNGSNGVPRKQISEDAYNLLKQAKDRAAEAQKIRTASTAMDAAKVSSDADAVAAACKVELDGKEYYKLAQDGSRVMLLTKDCVTSPAYDTNAGATNPAIGPFGDETSTNRWMTLEGVDSKAKAWCNGDYYDSLPAYTKNRIVEATYRTREQTGSKNFIGVMSKVFLLSEADVFGTDNGISPEPECYTHDGEQLIPSGDAGKNIRIARSGGSAAWWWLRSPRYNTSYVSLVGDGGGRDLNPYSSGRSVRPAFWIDLAS